MARAMITFLQDFTEIGTFLLEHFMKFEDFCFLVFFLLFQHLSQSEWEDGGEEGGETDIARFA